MGCQLLDQQVKLKVYPGLVPMYNDTMCIKRKVQDEELERWKSFQG